MADLAALEALKRNVDVGSTAGIIRDRNAANAAALGGVMPAAAVAPAVVPAAAPMVRGQASATEVAFRARMKAMQDAKLRAMLNAQQGVDAVATPMVADASILQ